MNETCTVIQYDPKYKEDFKSLNLEWIEEFFSVEPLDVKYLSDPEGEIISKGGMIFFALLDGKAVGTVALLNLGKGEYELAKMAVEKSQQGKGIGKQMMKQLIDWARKQDAVGIELITNTKLDRAMNLYLHSGFVPLPKEEFHSEYERGNAKMVLQL